MNSTPDTIGAREKMKKASRRFKPGSYRCKIQLVRERELPPYRIEGPHEIAKFIVDATDIGDEAQECVGVVLLDARHNINGFVIVARGRLNSCSVEPKEVFAPAMNTPCAAIVLFHNHPSGDPEPSEDDVRLTNRLNSAGRTLGIELLDHIVIGGEKWVSLRERGVL